ncbi:MAG: hypothetical protein AB7G44_03455 [Bacteroidia bacterium]
MISKGENRTINIAFRGCEEDLTATYKGLINIMQDSCLANDQRPDGEHLYAVLCLLEDMLPTHEQLCLEKK